ncbi:MULTISPECIES: metallophosphoesterase family protein [Acidiphilium]|uniref:Metallophosphoesterase n=1 Tax=Acidiphilium acidophilum TaxID=76588 RepID=A0AAW9DK29_ACIAO|nr:MULTISPECIES: metallophosphoesterase [Acidiphilium]MDX5929275.1 metallophosphoesterase [Acidiphilium acidophilum]
MHPICWLHISDIHMRVSKIWSQDVVLNAMCEDIAKQQRAGAAFDFILVTGDLAFSGNAEEYKLVASFFDAVSAASGVPADFIFCIPGNHDIDRERQKMCFAGARQFAQSQNQIDDLLSSREDMGTLLAREENYRTFQNTYLKNQPRDWTDDGLGYVAVVTIENVRVAIVGLDSAWLAEGGIADHGKLLIGEHQVINALELANKNDAHIIVGMAHHPFQLLQDFDRRPVQNRIEEQCHFFQCGHLHEPEIRATGLNASGCLTLSAGATYETRQSQNTYSIVTVDLMLGTRTVKTVQYRPAKGDFTFAGTGKYPIEIDPAGTSNVGELAAAITAFQGSLSPLSHYLAALLLDQKADLPIPAQKGYVFGSLDVLRDEPESELKRTTMGFIPFKNVLRVFYGRTPIAEIFTRYGDAVAQYGTALLKACAANADLKSRLASAEKDALAMATTAPASSFIHTVSLLDEVAAEQDWIQLRDLSERHKGSSIPELAHRATRYFALSLSHSTEAKDNEHAISLYRSMTSEAHAEAEDAAMLTTLFCGAKRYDEAKSTVLDGIAKYPDKAAAFVEIGQRVVEATGDKKFRNQIDEAVKARRW